MVQGWLWGNNELEQAAQTWLGFGLLYLIQVRYGLVLQFWLLHGMDWPFCRAFLGGSLCEWIIVLILAKYCGEL